MEFKRFSKDKQEQVRQFVAYAQMCGLSGADIRSIGDKLDRERKKAIKLQNMEIINSYELHYIGADKSYGKSVLNERFKLKTARGAYNFVNEYNNWIVHSLATGVKKKHSPDLWAYELGTTPAWAIRSRYAMLLDINSGKFNLDF